MRTSQKFLTIALWGLMVLGMLGLLGTGLWISRRTQATLGYVTQFPRKRGSPNHPWNCNIANSTSLVLSR